MGNNKRLSTSSIEKVFQKCSFGYPITVIEAEDSSVAAEKKLNEVTKEVSQIAEVEKVPAEMEKVQPCTSNLPQDMNNSVQEEGKPAQNGTNMCILKSAEDEGREGECFSEFLLLLLFKMGMIFLSLYFIFFHEK